MLKSIRSHSALAPILALLATASLAGCDRTSLPSPAPIYRSIPSSTIKSVDWYFDATASMKGFVAPGAGTGYSQFIMLLEESLDSLYLSQSMTPEKKVTFEKHRFGTAVDPFTNLGDTFKPAFYDLAKGYEDTDLKVVGDNLKPAGLTVVITDLFQSDNHVEAFRAALLSRGLGNSFQFGILAVSAQFSGTLYDIPPLKTSMPYQGPHPVYAIVLGPQKQVRDFIRDVLHRGGVQLGPGFVKAALLSSDLATPKVPLHDLKVQASGPSYLSLNDVDPAEDNEHAVIQGDTVPPFARSLRLPRAAASHPAIVYQTELEFDPFEVLPAGAEKVEAWKLESHVHPCGPVPQDSWWSSLRQTVLSLFSHTKGAPSTDQPGSSAQDAVPAGGQKAPDLPKGSSALPDPCPIRDTELLTEAPKVQIRPMAQNKGIVTSVSVDLGSRNDAANPIKALEKYIYVVDLKMIPSGEDYVLPSWVEDFSQAPGKPFNGRQTPNLTNFLTNMNQSIARGAQPAALDDYLYIQID